MKNFTIQVPDAFLFEEWTQTLARQLVQYFQQAKTECATTPINGLCQQDEATIEPPQVDRPLSVQIVVKFQIEGIHNWPDCPIEEVDYLKHPHRHIFHFEVRKKVSHNDRDIEIIQLGHQMKKYMHEVYYDVKKDCHVFGFRSCEMLATQLVREFDLDSCQVLEDGENGAIVTALDV